MLSVLSLNKESLLVLAAVGTLCGVLGYFLMRHFDKRARFTDIRGLSAKKRSELHQSNALHDEVKVAGSLKCCTQINELQISNFKLFTEKTYRFDPRFNLIIGANGSGKTSLLRAVAIALGGWAHGYIKDAKNHRPVADDEIREVQQADRFIMTKQTLIKANGKADVIDLKGEKKVGTASWCRQRVEGSDETTIDGTIKYNGQYNGQHDGQPTKDDINFSQLGSDILNYMEKGPVSFDLPLIAFYECNRLWLTDNKVTPVASAKAKYSRFDPYVDCFHTGADHQAVGEWLLKHQLASTQQNKETPILIAIREAAKSALENCTGLKFDFEKSRVMVEFATGHSVPFEHLSDGQRTMIGLFCDIARRAAILNPHFAGEASTKTAGVVLIDELDLHLHPRWQRIIIENLRSTFPKIQFICTTHSPFLIQSLREGQLIQMGEASENAFFDSSIEDIAEDIQGIELPQKSKRFTDMMVAAEAYYKKLHQCVDQNDEELTALKDRLDELVIPFSDDPAFAAQLRFEREIALAKKIKRKQGGTNETAG